MRRASHKRDRAIQRAILGEHVNALACRPPTRERVRRILVALDLQSTAHADPLPFHIDGVPGVEHAQFLHSLRIGRGRERGTARQQAEEDNDTGQLHGRLLASRLLAALAALLATSRIPSRMPTAPLAACVIEAVVVWTIWATSLMVSCGCPDVINAPSL